MEDKLVSVVIAAYNAALYIEECLKSIITQTYKNVEIWICDDASTDTTLEILRSYEKMYDNIHVLHNDVNMYAAYSRNQCIHMCRGKYIAIQDADDISKPERIEKLINAIEKESVDFVSSGHYLFDDNGIYKENIPKIIRPVRRDFLYGIPFCHAATMFTKECLKDVKGYRVSKETQRGQDYDLFMRLYVKGYVGVNISEILYGYRVDRNTISRRKFRYRLDECRIRYKGFKSLGLLPAGLPYVFKPIPAHVLQQLRNVRQKVK